MAWVIATVGLKGGVGKSTVALSLAGCLHGAGHKVLLVDTDDQATLVTWAARAAELGEEGPAVVAMSGQGLRRDLPRAAEGFDVAVIDTPPRLSEKAALAAMLAADLLVVPVTPGPADTWALARTLEVIEGARDIRPELRVVVTPNKVDRTNLAAATLEALGQIGDGVEVLDHGLGARVVFGEATAVGQTVSSYAPKSKAAAEVEALTAAVLEHLRKVG